MSKVKAQVITINYAGFEIEGLIFEGKRYISVSQFSRLLPDSVTQNNATRQVKTLAGKDSPLPKIPSELNSRPINVITLDEFEKVILAATFKGDKTAKAMVEASINTTISMAFDSALGIERVTRDYLADFNALVASKQTRRELTDTWQQCYEMTGQFPTYGKHTKDFYEAIGLLERYEEYDALGLTKNERRDYTFRHHFLSKEDRDKITDGEKSIQALIMYMDLTVDEAIQKLKEKLKR